MNFANYQPSRQAGKSLTLEKILGARELLRITLKHSSVKHRWIMSWIAEYPMQSLSLLKFKGLEFENPDAEYLIFNGEYPKLLARFEFSIERRVLTATFNPRFECTKCWQKVGG